MLVLGIESSAKAASAAVVRDGKLLGEFFVNTQQTHSQTLLPMVESLLKNLGIGCGEIDLMAVTDGPGSFTGIRIGVSCVKGLALPQATPCVGVSALEAIAYNGVGYLGKVVCAVMDARCAQVYNAMFRVSENGLERLCADRAISILELGEECRRYGGELVLFGDGAELCYREFAQWGAGLAPEAVRFQRASSVALLAEGRTGLDPADLLPVYLRMPQAERELKSKREKASN